MDTINMTVSDGFSDGNDINKIIFWRKRLIESNVLYFIRVIYRQPLSSWRTSCVLLEDISS